MARRGVEARRLKREKLALPPPTLTERRNASVLAQAGAPDRQSLTLSSRFLTDENLARESGESRRVMAGVLRNLLSVMAKQPAKRVVDLGGRNGRVATAKTLADALSVVYGWEHEGMTGLVVAGMIPEPGQAIATTTTALPEPGQRILSPPGTTTDGGETPLGAPGLIECAPREISTPSQSGEVSGESKVPDASQEVAAIAPGLARTGDEHNQAVMDGYAQQEPPKELTEEERICLERGWV